MNILRVRFGGKLFGFANFCSVLADLFGFAVENLPQIKNLITTAESTIST